MEYPENPGWRIGPNSATSEAAATAAATNAQPLKQRIMVMLGDGPATPEELVRRFAEGGDHILLNTARARCTDLFKLGRLWPSGTFGIGESGKVRVIRWRLMTEVERAQFLVAKAATAEKAGPDHG